MIFNLVEVGKCCNNMNTCTSLVQRDFKARSPTDGKLPKFSNLFINICRLTAMFYKKCLETQTCGSVSLLSLISIKDDGKTSVRHQWKTIENHW